MRLPTFDYVVGADLDDLGLFVRTNASLIDLSSGYTYSLKVVDQAGTTAFTTTTGFTGAAGSGLPPSGTPNLVKAWAVSGELNDLSAGAYNCQLTLTRSSDSRQRIRRFRLQMSAAL